jgi:hypothetical protein
MPTRISDEEFIACWKRVGSPKLVAAHLGLDIRGVYQRRNNIEERHGFILDSISPNSRSGRPKVVLPKVGIKAFQERVVGPVIVFSDLHKWPNQKRSVAFEALLTLIPQINPVLIVANGDSLDGASISRHPPIGWQSVPTVLDELQAVQEDHADIEAVAPKGAALVWTFGNHCLRFNSRLAANAAEFKGVFGTSLEDHFPSWDFSMLLEMNAGTKGHTVITHSIYNGQHAGYNNTLRAGVNVVTGHTHRLQAVHWGDYSNPTRWGIECGMLCDFGPDTPQFAYVMGRPVNWQQGFVVLTYLEDGTLLEPEFCRVINGAAYFRGQPVTAHKIINKSKSNSKVKAA